MVHILNAALTPQLIPFPDAGWGIIEGFALSFDGYTVHGSFAKGELMTGFSITT